MFHKYLGRSFILTSKKHKVYCPNGYSQIDKGKTDTGNVRNGSRTVLDSLYKIIHYYVRQNYFFKILNVQRTLAFKHRSLKTIRTMALVSLISSLLLVATCSYNSGIYALPGRGGSGLAGPGGLSGIPHSPLSNTPGAPSGISQLPNNIHPNNVNPNNPAANHCTGYGVSINPCGPNNLHPNNNGRTVVHPSNNAQTTVIHPTNCQVPTAVHHTNTPSITVIHPSNCPSPSPANGHIVVNSGSSSSSSSLTVNNIRSSNSGGTAEKGTNAAGLLDYLLPKSNQNNIVIPVANAGYNIMAYPYSYVTLDGSRSYDPAGNSLHFSWVQLDGDVVASLYNSNTSDATFIAPLIQYPTNLTFQLVVNNGQADSEPSYVYVTVVP